MLRLSEVQRACGMDRHGDDLVVAVDVKQFLTVNGPARPSPSFRRHRLRKATTRIRSYIDLASTGLIRLVGNPLGIWREDCIGFNGRCCKECRCCVASYGQNPNIQSSWRRMVEGQQLSVARPGSGSLVTDLLVERLKLSASVESNPIDIQLPFSQQ